MPRSKSIAPGVGGDQFSLWNIKLLEAFFSPASAGDSVCLQVDPSELDSLGPELGGDEGFVRAVVAGPAWGTVIRNGRWVSGDTKELVARLNGLVRQRKSPARRPETYLDPSCFSPIYLGSNAPAYLPFLAALVRSAVESDKGYYPHLRTALCLGASWGSQQMEALEFAWVDLQQWTEETKGDFGKFKFRILGAHNHVGVPRAQSVMARRDCEMLPLIFSQVGARVGQRLDPVLLVDIRCLAATSNYLSPSFRAALDRPEFSAIIDARLYALFEEWDGKVPASTIGPRQAKRPVVLQQPHGYVEVCLTLQDNDAFPWNLHWLLAPVVDKGELVLLRGDARWSLPIRGTDRGSTVADTGSLLQLEAANALIASRDGSVEFELLLGSDYDDSSKLPAVVLQKAILRILVWRYDDLEDRYELQEHPLPRHGQAYLLAADSNVKQVYSWLQRESISYEVLDSSGLPEGWLLFCLNDCSTLTEEQRDDMPDGETKREQYSAIRLAGGRSVSRAGIRQYMAYDMPFIELDAPDGTVLESSGLILKEEVFAVGLLQRTAIRRFSATPKSSGPGSFSINATKLGKLVGSVTLRVAADSGEYVETGHAFSLDPQGNPRRDNLGLRGTLASSPQPIGYAGARLEMMEADIGRTIAANYTESIYACAAAQFLDTLAQIGSIAYGAARDQLARLLAMHRNKITANIMLLDLRSRGHLEIEVNGRGHMTRVYAVPPVLYELSYTIGGRSAFGILGSLRTGQWKALAGFAGGKVYYSPSDEGFLASWRVAPDALDCVVHFGESAGFTVQGSPASTLASWAASSEDVCLGVEQIAGEGIGTGARGIEKLNANTARFFDSSNSAFDVAGATCQLFRMEDRDVSGLRTYALAVARGGKPVRFGFIRDSRWGVWIALGAFAAFMKEFPGFFDVSPWPIHYLRDHGVLFFPARVSLPVVLERALILCSGSGPESLEMSCGTSGLSSISLRNHAHGQHVADISLVYAGMAQGKWLAYKHIPEGLASLIAGKLGGTLAVSPRLMPKDAALLSS